MQIKSCEDFYFGQTEPFIDETRESRFIQMNMVFSF